MKKNKMIIKFLMVVFFAIFFVAAGGDNATKLKPPASPVKIQSDSMKYFGADKKSLFSGNVVAVSDNYTLTADNVTVFLNNDMDVEEIICIGNVNLKTQDILSISEKAELNQTKQTAILSGGVKVWQGENFLEGDRVIMYYVDNRIEVDKGKDKRVTIIFKPEDKESPRESGSQKPD